MLGSKGLRLFASGSIHRSDRAQRVYHTLLYGTSIASGRPIEPRNSRQVYSVVVAGGAASNPSKDKGRCRTQDPPVIRA